MPRNDLIQVRRGTAAQWAAVDPILAQGEFGHETDTGQIKIGDGLTVWSSLGYLSGGSGGGSTWGSVTGALSSQTDLQAALNAKVSSSGLSELIDDRISSLLVAGANILLTYDDTANTLTVASTGGSNNSYYPSGW